MTLKALILYSGIGGMHCGLYHARLLRRLRMRGISPFPPLSCEEHEEEAHPEEAVTRHTTRQIADPAQPESAGAATTRQEKRGGLQSENLGFDFEESACDAGEDKRPEAKEIAQEEDDDEKLIEALKGISRDGDSVCIHPIVSEFIRLPPSRTEPWPSSSMQPAPSTPPDRKVEQKKRTGPRPASAQREFQDPENGENARPDEKEVKNQKKTQGEDKRGHADTKGKQDVTEDSLLSPGSPESSVLEAGEKLKICPSTEEPTTATATPSPREGGDSPADSPSLLLDPETPKPNAGTIQEPIQSAAETAHVVSPSPSNAVSVSPPHAVSPSSANAVSPSGDVSPQSPTFSAESNLAADPTGPSEESPSLSCRPDKVPASSVSAHSPSPRFRFLPFEVVGVIDVNPTAMDVYRQNLLPCSTSPSPRRSASPPQSFPSSRPPSTSAPLTSTKSIDSFPASFYGAFHADIWLVSPPCQPFTRIGLQKGNADRRNVSFLYLLDVLCQLAPAQRPKYILLENVVRFEVSDTFDCLLHALECVCGYEVNVFHLNPLHFGIPNCRSRCFVTAKKSESPQRSDARTLRPALAWRRWQQRFSRPAETTEKGGDAMGREGGREADGGVEQRAQSEGVPGGDGSILRAKKRTIWTPLKPQRLQGHREKETETSGRQGETETGKRRTERKETDTGREEETKNGRKEEIDENQGKKTRTVSTGGPSRLDCWTCERCVRRQKRQKVGKETRAVLKHIPGVYASPAFYCCPIRPLEDFLDARFPPKAPFVQTEQPVTSPCLADPEAPPLSGAQVPQVAPRRQASGRRETKDDGEERSSNCEEQWEDISLVQDASSSTRDMCAVKAVQSNPRATASVYSALGFVPGTKPGLWRRQTAALILSQQQKERIWFSVDLVRRYDRRSSCFTRSYGRTGHAQYGSLLVLDEDLALEQRWAAFARKLHAKQGRIADDEGDTGEGEGTKFEEAEAEDEASNSRSDRCKTGASADARSASSARREMPPNLAETEKNGDSSSDGKEGGGGFAESQKARKGEKPGGKGNQGTQSRFGDPGGFEPADETEKGRRSSVKNRGKKSEETVCSGEGGENALILGGKKREKTAAEKRKGKKLAWLFQRPFCSLPFVFLSRGAVSSFLPPKKRNKGWELHDILPPETLVRFFSPNEMLALHGFPPSFSFPEADEPRAWPAQRRMVGNSLNVHLVGMLIDFLVEDRDWN
ncbi:UNVERIFIED_CONTAM: C-5 cytosine-specific DNA methylase superfamily protein [Hammondia hammondi]|eukprot:XP_008884330.1 C-5 cytosine-specific DNA methylase superfamily protein [Hammondia hammondi]